MKNTYTAYLVWALKDDALVRAAWQTVMGNPMLIKFPMTDRWEHDQMIRTNIMTDERKERFCGICGKKLKILKKPPLFWWGAHGKKGMSYG
jgi:hypothetical protein